MPATQGLEPFYLKVTWMGMSTLLPMSVGCLQLKPERNYCVTRKELLAVVTFLNQFQHYLIGRPFIIHTDHGALTWLQNFKSLEGQLARWLEKL